MFCSETFEWKVMNITCDSRFDLELRNPNSVVMEEEGVVHWFASTEALQRAVVVFDQRKKCLQLVALPEEVRGCDGFSGSDGRIFCAGFNRNKLELDLWELKKRDDLRNEWSLLFRVDKMPTEMYPQGFRILCVHPLNPLVLFITFGITFGIGYKIIMYDVENSKMEFVCDVTSTHFFLAYVWPNWPPFFPSSSSS
ncbi:hypothetical protein FRX31_026440 [Thalictrum thalictroides]|uniref:F-box associated domain-containing protein n=1 Tax=Thalictrum thalictroides TaxID=46969 RepID=A0A7J6VI47_THATH|nr:hypothetical protein FRX31_026440 [Thalictrum thalictroides]